MALLNNLFHKDYLVIMDIMITIHYRSVVLDK